VSDATSSTKFTFRAGTHVFVLVGVAATFFMALALAAGIRSGDWSFAAALAAVIVLWLGLLSILKLEIRPDGFTYRNLSGIRSVEFADVEIAYFKTIVMNGMPAAAAFWVRLRDGKGIKINLRTFSVRAAAVLLSALDAHEIPIRVPDTWPARRMAGQIRDVQAKMRG
jgi:hypothetical protein